MGPTHRRQAISEVRSRLSLATKALFGITYRLDGQQNGNKSNCLALCLAISNTETGLQRLEKSRHSIEQGVWTDIIGEWNRGLDGMLQSVAKPCTCGYDGTMQQEYRMMAPDAKPCPYCLEKVQGGVIEMERLVKSSEGRLELEMFIESVRNSSKAEGGGVPALIEQFRDKHSTEMNDTRDTKIKVMTEENDRTGEQLRVTSEELERVTKELDETKGRLAQAEEYIAALEGREKGAIDECGMRIAQLEGAMGQLSQATEAIEEYAQEFVSSENWGNADDAFEELCRMAVYNLEVKQLTGRSEEEIRAHEIKLLEYKQKRAQALMKLGDNAKAETLAREVFDRKRQLFPPNSVDIRSVHRDYCSILLQKNKEEAEREYIYVWYSRDLCNSSNLEDKKWRLESGFQIATVMTEQQRYGEAAIWHRRVLEARCGMLPTEVNNAALSAVRLIRVMEKLNVPHDIAAMLQKIWDAREQARDTRQVVTCGNEYGTHLSNTGNCEKAQTVLETVWNKRKSWGPDHTSDAMTTALTLAKVYTDLQSLDKFEDLYTWIYSTKKRLSPNAADTFRFGFALGCVQHKNGRYKAAEATLQALWDEKKPSLQHAISTISASKSQPHHKTMDYSLGAEHHQTIAVGQILAETLTLQNKHQSAKPISSLVWSARATTLGPSHVDSLEAGHIHGDVLFATDDLNGAEKVLRDVWETVVSLVSSSSLTPDHPLFSMLVGTGDCFASALIKLEKYPAAKDVLSRTENLKLRAPSGAGEKGQDLAHTRALLGQVVSALEELGRKRSMSPPPLPPSTSTALVTTNGTKGGKRGHAASVSLPPSPRLAPSIVSIRPRAHPNRVVDKFIRFTMS